MKRFFAILFSLCALHVAAQKQDSIWILDPALFKTKVKKFNFQVQSYLSGDYIKAFHSHTTTKMQPLGVYYCSNTIWDESEIILIDSTKFFCYYVSDIEKFCSAGYYKKEADLYVFHADEKLYKGLRHSIKLRSEKLYFSNDFYMCATFLSDTLSAFH